MLDGHVTKDDLVYRGAPARVALLVGNVSAWRNGGLTALRADRREHVATTTAAGVCLPTAGLAEGDAPGAGRVGGNATFDNASGVRFGSRHLRPVFAGRLAADKQNSVQRKDGRECVRELAHPPTEGLIDRFAELWGGLYD